MRKQSLTLAVLILLSAVLSGCSSESQVEELVQQVVGEPKSYPVVIIANKPSDDAITRSISEVGSSLSTSWVAGEKVYAYKGDTGTPLSVTLTADDISADGKKATLKFEFNGTFAVNDEIVLYYQKEKDSYNDYSGQLGTLADIAANFDRMKATVTVTAVNPSTNEILATTNANFVRLQAITKFTVKKKSDNSAFSITPLSIGENSLGTVSINLASPSSVVWIALPGRASTDAAASKSYKFEAKSESKVYGVTKTVDLINNKYYTATLTMGRDVQKLNLAGIPTSGGSQPYGGSPVNVTTVTSGDDTPETLTSPTDYDVTYKKWNTTTNEWENCDAADVEEAGKYKVVVTGTGEFEGTKEQEFDITKITAATVNAALTAGTIADGTQVAQGVNTAIVPDNVLGMTGAQIKAGSIETGSSISIGTQTPNTGWATINNDGQLVTTGGGIVTVTIALPETANHEAGSVTKTIYVKQSGIGGEVPDPTTETW